MTSINLDTDFHILKKWRYKDGKRTNKYVYYAASTNPDWNHENPKACPKYLIMKSTGQTSKTAARKVALHWMQTGELVPDKPKEAKDSISYLSTVFEPESTYVRRRRSLGKSMSLTYINISKSWIDRYFVAYCKERGITRMGEITRKFVDDWQLYLYESKVIGPVTVNKVLQAVKVAFGQAVRDELIPSNPASYIEPVEARERERGIFSLEEYEKLFAEPWDDLEVYSACYLSATTAMRLGEVRGLLVKNLDLKKGVVHIKTSWQDNEGIKDPKWKSFSHEDGLPLAPGVIKVLSEIVQHHRWGADPGRFVFWDIDSPDRPIGKEKLTKGLYAAMKRVGIDRKAKNLTFHSLRHTMITTLKDDPRLLRYFARHKQERITERYIHLTEEDTNRFESTISGRFSFAS